jgi:hypothetical protein
VVTRRSLPVQMDRRIVAIDTCETSYVYLSRKN